MGKIFLSRFNIPTRHTYNIFDIVKNDGKCLLVKFRENSKLQTSNTLSMLNTLLKYTYYTGKDAIYVFMF